MKSSPTDHLANERTFLAYVRTALSFVAFGFIVARFALFSREMAVLEHGSSQQPTGVSVSLGVAMTLAGIVVAIFGAWRYAAEKRALTSGSQEALSARAAGLTTAAVVIFGAIIAVDLLRLH